MSQKENKIKDLQTEIDLLDDMLAALVVVLEEKGVLTNREWEDKIQKRIKGKPSKSFRDL